MEAPQTGHSTALRSQGSELGKPERREAPCCPLSRRNKGGVSAPASTLGEDPPGTTGPLLACPTPTARHIMESRGRPPGQGRAGPPWSSPTAVSRLRWRWGQLLTGSCPPLATGPSPLPLRACFFTRNRGPASEVTWQLLWPTPLPGEPPLGAASGQKYGGQGPRGWGLQLFRRHFFPNQKTQLSEHCACLDQLPLSNCSVSVTSPGPWGTLGGDGGGPGSS